MVTRAVPQEPEPLAQLAATAQPDHDVAEEEWLALDLSEIRRRCERLERTIALAVGHRASTATTAVAAAAAADGIALADFEVRKQRDRPMARAAQPFCRCISSGRQPAARLS